MNVMANWFDAERARVLLTAAVPRVVSALIILGIFWVVWRSTRPLLRNILMRAGFAPALIDMLVDGLWKATIAIVALITSASQVGINVGGSAGGPRRGRHRASASRRRRRSRT